MSISSLHRAQDVFFNIFILVNYLLYGLFSIGFAANAPQYLDILDTYVKIYISLFLLWRFNVFRSVQFTDLDRKIVFSAGLFLFSTTVVNQLLVSYLTSFKRWIQSKLPTTEIVSEFS